MADSVRRRVGSDGVVDPPARGNRGIELLHEVARVRTGEDVAEGVEEIDGVFSANVLSLSIERILAKEMLALITCRFVSRFSASVESIGR